MAKQTFNTGDVLTASAMTSLQNTAMLGGSANAKTASYVLVAADAGTAITMNNAGATTITVNTGLFAAGDIVTILNIGAGTCTITAGTATVSKPTNASLALVSNAGGVLYFTATGTAIFMPFDTGASSSPLTTKGDLFTWDTTNTRLGVGTNGQALVADSTASTGLKWGYPTSLGVSVFKSANQSISNATNTIVTFDSEDYDTNNFHSTVTNTSRLTVPSGLAGKYLVNANIVFNNNATGIRILYFMKNGSNNCTPSLQNASSSLGTYLTGSGVFNLAVGDYIEIQVYQSSGGALDILGTATSCQAQLTYLGA